MCKHHINIMNLHKDNKSTPASLFFNRFPEPFFGHDIEFIQAYNKRIVEFQTNVMNDIILFSEKKIAIYEEIIEKHISSINDKPFNFNNLKENKFKDIELKNKDYFENKINKARRCIAKPFDVKLKPKDTNTLNGASRNDSGSNASTSFNHLLNSSFNYRSHSTPKKLNRFYSNNSNFRSYDSHKIYNKFSNNNYDNYNLNNFNNYRYNQYNNNNHLNFQNSRNRYKGVRYNQGYYNNYNNNFDGSNNYRKVGFNV